VIRSSRRDPICAKVEGWAPNKCPSPETFFPTEGLCARLRHLEWKALTCSPGGVSPTGQPGTSGCNCYKFWATVVAPRSRAGCPQSSLFRSRTDNPERLLSVLAVSPAYQGNGSVPEGLCPAGHCHDSGAVDDSVKALWWCVCPRTGEEMFQYGCILFPASGEIALKVGNPLPIKQVLESFERQPVPPSTSFQHSLSSDLASGWKQRSLLRSMRPNSQDVGDFGFGSGVAAKGPRRAAFPFM
jgi:hypothetical protein